MGNPEPSPKKLGKVQRLDGRHLNLKRHGEGKVHGVE